MYLLGVPEVISSVIEPANKLIDATTGAIGKAYEPKHMRKMADIFNDPMMRETNMEGIVRRVKMVFYDRTYQRRLKTTDKKWMDDKLEDILNGLITFLENCEK